jgi:hypothetical protein
VSEQRARHASQSSIHRLFRVSLLNAAPAAPHSKKQGLGCVYTH